MKLCGIILAGGSGTRLWPLSRKMLPKQLLSLTGDNSLLQETSRRILPIIPISDQCVITNDELYNQIKKQFGMNGKESMEEKHIDILKEPYSKNTAPAILWAANRYYNMYGNDCIIVVLPSDHLIIKEEVFLGALKTAIEKASEGSLVTFGIYPTYPESGYGYIQTSETISNSRSVYHIQRFVEKPDMKVAERFIKEGSYLWNSGIFVFHVGTLLQEASKYCPDIYEAFTQCNADCEEDVEKAFATVLPISIDNAIMEHTDKAYVVHEEFGWSDVGSWKSLYEVSPKDEKGNTFHGEHISIETTNSLVYGGDRLIVTLGLDNIAIIDTDDALLVSSLDQTFKIKEVVEILKRRNSKIHIEHLTVDRPWSKYKIMQSEPRYKIKKITVESKHKLSKQYHLHRSEHWIVVKGTAKVLNGDKEYFIYENESTFIPKGVIHRLENPGILPLEIIEIQSGSYLEEDDIFRLDDDYKR